MRLCPLLCRHAACSTAQRRRPATAPCLRPSVPHCRRSSARATVPAHPVAPFSRSGVRPRLPLCALFGHLGLLWTVTRQAKDGTR